jgi:uncharacterized membrane protein YdjX (TVP38/TMEM64 family)
MDSALDRLRSRVAGLQLFESPAHRRRFLLHAAIAAVVVVVIIVLIRRQLTVLTDRRALRSFVEQYGEWTPVVFIAIQATQVVVAPIPGQVVGAAAGYLFGTWKGTLYSMIGVTIGSTIAFWLSRRYGRAYVERMIHDDRLEEFDAIDDNYVRLTLFFFFLVPGLPDDALCFAGGLTKVPLWQLVVIAVVGRTPAFFLVNVVGDLVGRGEIAAAAALAAAVGVLSLLGYLYRDRLGFGGS